MNGLWRALENMVRAEQDRQERRDAYHAEVQRLREALAALSEEA